MSSTRFYSPRNRLQDARGNIRGTVGVAVQSVTLDTINRYSTSALPQDANPASVIGGLLLQGQFEQAVEQHSPGWWNWTMFPGVSQSSESQHTRAPNAISVIPYIVCCSKEPPRLAYSQAGGRDAYKTITVSGGGATRANVRAFHIDTRYLRLTEDTLLSIISAVNSTNSDECFITVLPYVSQTDYGARINEYQGIVDNEFDVWSISGPSLGLALAACLRSGPSIAYTGYLSQVARDRTLSSQSPTGVGATIAGAACVESIQFVEYKSAWAVAVGVPLVIPLSDSYEQDITPLLMNVGRSMLRYKKQGDAQFRQSYLGAQRGVNPNSITDEQAARASNLAGASYMYAIKDALFSMQDVEMNIPFQEDACYLLAAKNFAGTLILASIAFFALGFPASPRFTSALEQSLNATTSAVTRAAPALQSRAKLAADKRVAQKASRVGKKGGKRKQAAKPRAKQSAAMAKYEAAVKALQSAGFAPSLRDSGMAQSLPTTQSGRGGLRRKNIEKLPRRGEGTSDTDPEETGRWSSVRQLPEEEESGAPAALSGPSDAQLASVGDAAAMQQSAGIRSVPLVTRQQALPQFLGVGDYTIGAPAGPRGLGTAIRSALRDRAMRARTQQQQGGDDES